MHRRASWRLSALVLTVLWSVVPLLTAVHGAFQAHVWCAEHRAFEHPPGDHDHGDGGTRDAISPESPDVDGSHQVCALVHARLRHFLQPAGTVSAVAVSPSAVTESATGHQADRPQLAVLANAPKASPPA